MDFTIVPPSSWGCLALWFPLAVVLPSRVVLPCSLCAAPASPTVAENEAVHNLHGKPGGCDTGTMWRGSFHGAKSANFDGV